MENEKIDKDTVASYLKLVALQTELGGDTIEDLVMLKSCLAGTVELIEKMIEKKAAQTLEENLRIAQLLKDLNN